MQDIVERFVTWSSSHRFGNEPLPRLQRCRYPVGEHTIFARVNEEHWREQPVVFVHGIGVSGLYMVPTAQRVARTHPVYVPDLPGFGNSSKPPHTMSVRELSDALAGFLEAAGLEDVTLVGNSFGCQIAARCAAEHPERVARLILQAPGTEPAGRTYATQIRRWLKNALREPASEALILLRDYLKCGMRRLLHAFRASLEDPFEEVLVRIEAPTLVVRGARDPISKQSWVEAVATRLLDGHLEIIPGAAHTVNYACPREFAGSIRGFLASPSSQVHT